MTYLITKADISAWLPKIKVGGVIAGHDYIGEWPGVKQAVNEAFDNVIVVPPKSWMIRV